MLATGNLLVTSNPLHSSRYLVIDVSNVMYANKHKSKYLFQEKSSKKVHRRKKGS